MEARTKGRLVVRHVFLIKTDYIKGLKLGYATLGALSPRRLRICF